MLFTATLIFAILQTPLAFPTDTNDKTPLDQFSNILPLKELKELKMKHLQTDPNFQAAVKYFKSPEWISIIEELRKTPEWIEYKKFIKDAGLDLDYFIKHLEHCVNATDVTDLKVDENVKPSLNSFIQEAEVTYGIPIIKGLQAYYQKEGMSDTVQKLKTELMSVKSKELLEKALEQPAVKKFIEKLEEMDVRVKNTIQLIYSLNGWMMVTTTVKV